ncbi:MAG: hypothetical protein PHD97_08500 [Bacteroidales bacterium]|nr:hypothetical protein [Bacteroidales bacterium]
MKKFFLILFYCLSFILKQSHTEAQTVLRGEESKVKETADKYFSKEDFISAQPLYSQLLSLHQQNAEYCYKFGVCLLYTNTKDLNQAIKYLEYALKQSGTPNKIYYYLGRAYHLDYRFNEAIYNYTKYSSFLKDNSTEKNDIEHQIEMCKNGKKLLSTISDIYVMQKKEILETGFFRNYNMQSSNEYAQSIEFGGKYLPKPDEFKTKLDKKLEDANAIIFITDSNEIYYSSYGMEGNNKKDIYKVVKKKEGGWSVPENLGTIINTKYDEDYPFMLPDGKTLYFCSKGHNSMGGYDIFKSVYSKTNETWSEPENLDFAINTPYDDILFVTDSSQMNAYFSSNRKNTPKMITFYNVRIDKRPIIANDIKLDIASNDNLDTSYRNSISLIKAKAELNVNTGDEIFKPLFYPDSAEITMNTEDTEDETQTGVNANEEDTTSVNTDISNSDIIGIAYDEANKTQNEVKELEIQLNTTLNIANKKNQQSNDLKKEYEKIIETANTITDNTQKEEELSKARKVKYEAETLKKEASVAYTITKQLEKKITEKKKDAVDAMNYAKTIEKAANTKTKEESIALLDSLSKRIEENEKNKEEPINKDDLSPNRQDYLQKKNEAEKYAENAGKLRDEASLIKEQSDLIKKDIENTRKSSVKETLKNQLAIVEEEYKNKMDEVNLANDKAKKTQLQADSIYNDLTMINNLITEINDNTDSIIKKTNKELAQSNNQNTKTKIPVNKNTKKNAAVKKTTKVTTNENILNKQKYDSVLTSSINISNTIKNKAEEYNKTASIYFTESSRKNEEAKNNIKKANEISEQAKTTSNKTEQNKLLFKADSLIEQSRKKNSEANINYDIAKTISEKQKEIQKDANDAAKYANEIKKEGNYNYKVAKSSSKQKDIITNNKVYIAPKIEISKIISEITANKEKEKASESIKITNLEKENSVISDSITILKNELNDRKTQTQKKETIKEQIKLLETKSESNKDKITTSKAVVDKISNDTKNLKNNQLVNAIIKENENKTQTQNLPEVFITDNILIEKNLSENNNKIKEVSISINNVKNNTVAENTKDKEKQPDNTGIRKTEPDVKPKEAETKKEDANFNAINDNQITKVEIYNLKTEANAIRENAKNISDKKQKQDELNRADELDKNAETKKTELQNKPNYTKTDIAADNKVVLDRIAVKNDSITEIVTANYLKNNADKLIEKAKEKTDEANNAETNTEKNRLLKEAEALTDEAIRSQEKAIDLIEKHPSETIIKKQIVKTTGTTAETKTETANNTETNTPAPIPVNITVVTTIDNKTYDGLVFKVQISAVTKEAPVEAFRGLDPISSGKTDNGLFLYYFGLFNNFNEASNAKNDVRSIGFNDAFVVAFLNGKKIPLREALDMLKTNAASITLSNSTYNIDKALLANRKPEKTREMPEVDGLYYSVQVGVFGRTVTPAQLFNIEPLYYEKTPTGNYRYTTGVYNKLNDAVYAKRAIVNRGVTDAFVVAFYNGRKINVAEARDLLNRKEATLATTNIPSSTGTATAANIKNEKPTIPENRGMFYSVQVGVYARKITSEKLFNIAPLYFDITARGYYRYITETYTNVRDAINAKNRIVARGVTDAFVVAFNNGKQITINEARRMEK